MNLSKLNLKKVVSEHKAEIVSTLGVVVATIAQNVHAEVTAFDPAVITSSMNSIVTNTMGMIAGVAPIGITIFGSFFVWRKAMSFFKTVAK